MMAARTRLSTMLATLAFPTALAAQTFVPLVPPEMHYVVDVTLDTVAHNMSGSGSVIIRNTGKRAIDGLRFRWFPWRSGSYEITLNGKTQQYPSTTTFVTLPLSKPLAPGAQATVNFRFTRALGDLATGFGIQRWLPQVWWGYDTHASYDVAISAPADLIVATTARADARDGHYRADHVRTFGLYFARGFQSDERNAHGTLVRSIFRPDMRECAELVLNTAADAINYYRQRVGMYPQPSLTIMPGSPQPVGGYPYATGMVVVHGQQACSAKPRSHWQWIASHEVGHQYWIEHVMEKEPEQGWGWLLIGLGIWLDREYARTHELPTVHPALLDEYANAVRQGKNTTINITPEALGQLDFDYNTAVTHAKGFGIISGLAAVVGPQAFDRSYRRALREYAGRRLGADDFRRIVEDESGMDLGWYFTPLLRSSGFAAYEIVDTVKNERGVSVRVVASGSVKLPLPIEARFANGERRRAILDRALDEQVVEFASTSPLKEVVIDPDREFPIVNPPPSVDARRLAELMAQLPWSGAGDKALRLYGRAVELDAKDTHVWTKLALTLFDGRHYQEAMSAFDRVIALTPTEADANWHFAALVWRGMLNDLLGHRAVALTSYQQALAMGGQPAMRHDQFSLVINREFAQARLQTPFSWK